MASCLHPITIKAPQRDGWRPRTHYIAVPCGKCPVCLRKRQQDWTIRMEKETEYIEKQGGSCFFITLTYSDDFLPIDDQSGYLTLFKPDAQNFLESFKRRIKYYFHTVPRYYLCGEYGDSFMRPHYHALIWLPGLKITSEDLRSHIVACWNNGLVLGIHPFTTKLAEYVAKYSVKQYGTDYSGMQSPFALMSLKPAIGSQWIKDNRDFYLDNPHPFLTDSHGVRFSLPRYFRSRVYSLSGYYNYVDACIVQHDLQLQLKLDFYGNTSFLRDIDMAHERFIEHFWNTFSDKRKFF